jgi:hypothetical protein
LKLYCLACEVLARPLYLSAARSAHIIDIQLIQRGLHNQPANLRSVLQAAVDAASEKSYDAIAMGYGLCGQATAGLTARSLPLVIPRAHDCITLFLGSRERYQEQFENFPGTYWYAQDYIERDDGSGGSLALGSGVDTNVDEVYAEYVEKYGQDNADYLMEVMGAWKQHYKRAAYIDMGVGDGTAVASKAQEQAARRGWAYDRVRGDMVLLRRLLDGDWDKDFLILQPGQKLTMTYDDDVIGCAFTNDP